MGVDSYVTLLLVKSGDFSTRQLFTFDSKEDKEAYLVALKEKYPVKDLKNGDGWVEMGTDDWSTPNGIIRMSGKFGAFCFDLPKRDNSQV